MKKSVLKVRQLSVSYTHLLDNKNKNSLEGVTAVSVFSSSLNGARAVIVFHRVQLYPHATSVPVTRCTVSTRDLQVLVAIIKKNVVKFRSGQTIGAKVSLSSVRLQHNRCWLPITPTEPKQFVSVCCRE